MKVICGIVVFLFITVPSFAYLFDVEYEYICIKNTLLILEVERQQIEEEAETLLILTKAGRVDKIFLLNAYDGLKMRLIRVNREYANSKIKLDFLIKEFTI